MTSAGPAPAFDTVILAGGGAARMGGADKPGLAVGARPMLVSVAQAAAAAGTSRLIVVGPPRAGAVQDGLAALAAGRPGWLACVCEEPAGRGPVAGLRCGLAEVSAPCVVLLAADLPFLTGAHLTALLTAGALTASRPDVDLLAAEGSPVAKGSPAAAGAAGVVVADATGRPQWLASCWHAGPLRHALAAYDGESLRGLLAPLSPARMRLESTAGTLPPWLDCDTPDDLAAARRAWLACAADSGGSL
jgi:molybdenum cofactor guanylyltransferase